MNDERKNVVFEWDAYWDEAESDEKSARCVSDPIYDYDPPSAAQVERSRETVGGHAQAASAANTWQKGIMEWGTPVLVVGALLAATTLPKSLGMDGVKIQSSDLIGLSPRQAERATAQVQLLVYSERQQEMFSSGLRRLGDTELLAYARRTQEDLLRANAEMSAHLQDALTLTRLEVERRKLTFPAISPSEVIPATVQARAQSPVVVSRGPVMPAPDWSARSENLTTMPASLLPLLPSPDAVLIPLPE